MIPSPRHIQTLILLLVQAAEQLACASPVARGRGWPDWKEWMPQGTPRLGLIGATSIIICMMCWFTAIKAVYLYNFLVSIRVWGGGEMLISRNTGRIAWHGTSTRHASDTQKKSHDWDHQKKVMVSHAGFRSWTKNKNNKLSCKQNRLRFTCCRRNTHTQNSWLLYRNGNNNPLSWASVLKSI